MSSITATAAEAATIRRMVDEGWTPDAAAEHVARMARSAKNGPPCDSAPEKVSAVIESASERQRANKRREPHCDTVPDVPEIAPQSEKQFQSMCEYVFRSEGFLVYHTYNSRRSEPGFPDLVAVHPDRGIIFAELKMPKGKPSAAQTRWLEAIRAAGHNAYLWYPSDFGEIQAIARGEVYNEQ